MDKENPTILDDLNQIYAQAGERIEKGEVCIIDVKTGKLWKAPVGKENVKNKQKTN